MKEYPKYVNGLIVQNASEEEAVRDGRAVIREVHSAQGVSRSVVGIQPKSRVKKSNAKES